ncbi:hypothetical protein HPB49_021067 [Dermacentor silvarum]|uniref:Uncharacterized protein n=1 Tax=Dermacentor silvarum TaxID=543639 RepID=A0ACB8D7W4_DERSI|nr:hypothetical protein HPB49_021067 [Dermacentor silvarum]
MHPDRHKGRRQARTQALARIFGDCTSDTPVLYTDVARCPQRRAVCLVVLDSTDTLRASATLNTVDSGMAEEAAIARAISYMLQPYRHRMDPSQWSLISNRVQDFGTRDGDTLHTPHPDIITPHSVT